MVQIKRVVARRKSPLQQQQQQQMTKGGTIAAAAATAQRKTSNVSVKQRRRIKAVENAKLDVHNISKFTSAASLEAYFATYGKVVCVSINRRNSVRTYATIRFENEDEMRKGLKAHNSILDGHNICVSKSGSYQRTFDNCVYLFNCANDVQYEDISKTFEACGDIEHINMYGCGVEQQQQQQQGGDNLFSGGKALIKFRDAEGMRNALKIRRTFIRNRLVEVLSHDEGKDVLKGTAPPPNSYQHHHHRYNKPGNNNNHRQHGGILLPPPPRCSGHYQQNHQKSCFFNRKPHFQQQQQQQRKSTTNQPLPHSKSIYNTINKYL